MLFTETGPYRGEKFIFRLSPDERKFLREEARKRGVRVVSLLRMCLRQALIDATASQEQG